MNTKTALLILLSLLTGCSSLYYPHYTPTTIAQGTGLYVTTAKVDPKDIRVYVTQADLKNINFVYLESIGEIHPLRLEFFLRETLVRMGFTRVLNETELNNFILSNEELSSIRSIRDKASLEKLCQKTGPFLVINSYANNVPPSGAVAYLSVTKYPTDNALLIIDISKTNISDFDMEMHYPMLNELKKWGDTCKEGKQI